MDRKMMFQNATPSVMVLDPESCFVKKWKRFMAVIGILSVTLEPLFLYVPHSKGPHCLGIDMLEGLSLAIARSLLDLFHLVHMILKFFIAVEGKGPKVFKTRNLIKQPRLIAINYFKSFFIADLLAILPLPQVVIWSKSLINVHEILTMVVTMQFAPRMISLSSLRMNIIEAVGGSLRNVWAGAVNNVLMFILIGHFLGAVYYQSYFGMLELCLSTAFENETNSMKPAELDCSQAHEVCVTRHKELGYGMFSDAFENQIGSRSFVQKMIYCFVWGVRSLSSLGQTFDVSFNVMETTFSCMVIIIGLILLADLIARMQTSVQSLGARRERQRVKQRRVEEWTHYHNLPPDLKGRVRQSVQSEWLSTKGIEDEGFFNSIPLDLRCDIRNYLYKERVRNIPPFNRMDDQLLDFICGHLRTFVRAEGTYLVLQGDPVKQMVFIFSGLLQLSHHSGGGRSTSRSLEAGDFFGEELLTWASQSNAWSQDLPPSACSVKCLSNVEAFCLPAEDVRILAVFNYTQMFHLALRHHLA